MPDLKFQIPDCRSIAINLESVIWNLQSSIFERQPVFACGIALLAARYKITLGRFAAADDRHQMIHRKLRRRELAAAVVTNPRAALALPPLALT